MCVPDREWTMRKVHVFHDEVMIEGLRKLLTHPGGDDDEHAVFAHDHSDIADDSPLELDGQPIDSAPHGYVGEVAREKPVEPRNAVAAAHHDDLELGRAHDEGAAVGVIDLTG